MSSDCIFCSIFAIVDQSGNACFCNRAIYSVISVAKDLILIPYQRATDYNNVTRINSLKPGEDCNCVVKSRQKNAGQTNDVRHMMTLMNNLLSRLQLISVTDSCCVLVDIQEQHLNVCGCVCVRVSVLARARVRVCVCVCVPVYFNYCSTFIFPLRKY